MAGHAGIFQALLTDPEVAALLADAAQARAMVGSNVHWPTSRVGLA